jgi:Sulfotransferase family
MNERPIFISGCSKSGTTLVRNLFDGHKDLFVIPVESHFFQNICYWVSYYSRRTKPRGLTFDDMKLNIIEWISYMNLTNNPLVDSFTMGKWDMEYFSEILNLNPVNNTRELFDAYVKALYCTLHKKDYNEKTRFVEKSVENAEMTIDLVKLYPKASFVHILRNPYSNIVAIRNYLGQKRRFPVLKSAVFEMYNSYYHMYRNRRLIENMTIIKYEDLIQNPIKTMKEIAIFLGIEYNDILTKPTLFEKNWTGNSSSGIKFTGISNVNLETWKRIITPLEINIVNELFDFIMEDFDYKIIDSSRSILKYNKKEGIKNYFLNRVLWYYMPRFKK